MRSRRADVFVLIAGFHYGSPVRDKREVSYPELELNTAIELGIPSLVFMLREATNGLPGWPMRLIHGLGETF
jgi:hypothetical protein